MREKTPGIVLVTWRKLTDKLSIYAMNMHLSISDISVEIRKRKTMQKQCDPLFSITFFANT